MDVSVAAPHVKVRRGNPSLRWLRWVVTVAVVVFVPALPLLSWANSRVIGGAAPFVFTDLQDVPSRPVGIVFGALVAPDGSLSPVLEERVRAGVELYRAGKVRKLLMTGDNGRLGYDEVTAMKREAVALGVPARDVVRDFAGFRTYDSCVRARDVFDVQGAVLVTQRYHLSRALYLARHLGIDAVGYVAQPGAGPHQLGAWERREWLARAEAILDLNVLHRAPRFLGPREPLFRNERDSR